MKITKTQLKQIIKEELEQVDEIFGLTTTKSADSAADSVRSTYSKALRAAEEAIAEIVNVIKPKVDPGLQSQLMQIVRNYENNKTVDDGQQERSRPRLRENNK